MIHYLLALCCCFLITASAFAKETPGLREFTEADLKELAHKMGVAVAQCPHEHADDPVIVGITNQTDELVDKKKFAELIRNELTGHKGTPNTISPPYDVRGRLTMEKQEKKRVYKAVYTLTAEVFQNDKKICEKTEKLEKTGKTN